MSLNKKQKKQLDLAHKKLHTLNRRLSDAKKQPDDPQDIVRLQQEIAGLQAEIEKIKSA